MTLWKRWLSLLVLLPSLRAQGPANVLVVVNDDSALSRSIAEYYVRKRAIPARNLCHVRAPVSEEISRDVFVRQIESKVGDCLQRERLTEQILYIATTGGVPLRIAGQTGESGDMASVDSELTMLYADLRTGKQHPINGPLRNPFFGKRDAVFTHAAFPIYLVTRLAGYDFPSVRAMIDRSMQARSQGKFVIDLKSNDDQPGNNWLRTAAILLPADRVVIDESAKVLYAQRDVIGYAAWGSNDPNRRERFVRFQWLPGAIATEFVSTNARTLARPPRNWTISDWKPASAPRWFAGSPQTMSADYIEEGSSAATGHVAEPYLQYTPRPDLLLPAYSKGRNLAESYYLSIPALSWQNIVIGDPLMTLSAAPK